MNLLTNHVWSGMALLAALSLTPSHAQAQQGSSHLPVEAHWGSVVLPPGFYHISIPRRASWPEMVELSSHGQTLAILPEFETSQPASDHSYVSLVKTQGTYAIREFHAGASGKVFTFPLPKRVEKKFADLRPVPTTPRPLEVSGQ